MTFDGRFYVFGEIWIAEMWMTCLAMARLYMTRCMRSGRKASAFGSRVVGCVERWRRAKKGRRYEGDGETVCHRWTQIKQINTDGRQTAGQANSTTTAPPYCIRAPLASAQKAAATRATAKLENQEPRTKNQEPKTEKRTERY
jgi:hypothetical protein